MRAATRIRARPSREGTNVRAAVAVLAPAATVTSCASTGTSSENKVNRTAAGADVAPGGRAASTVRRLTASSGTRSPRRRRRISGASAGASGTTTNVRPSGGRPGARRPTSTRAAVAGTSSVSIVTSGASASLTRATSAGVAPAPRNTTARAGTGWATIHAGSITATMAITRAAMRQTRSRITGHLPVAAHRTVRPSAVARPHQVRQTMTERRCAGWR